jgi:hypothetical protein
MILFVSSCPIDPPLKSYDNFCLTSPFQFSHQVCFSVRKFHIEMVSSGNRAILDLYSLSIFILPWYLTSYSEGV